MANRKSNLKLKRRSKETNEPESKHPRIDDGDGPATNTKKLTDVVDDCLERIFMHLSLEDLLNIADTNKKLKPAADMAFQRKFCKMEFSLRKVKWLDKSTNIGEFIQITDKKTQMHLLRCFGHSITKLDIRHSWVFGKRLISYANEYCFDSLTAIKIVGFDYIRNSMLKKPFTNIEVVKFYLCKLYADTNLKRWFPSLRHLELPCSTFTNGMFIVKKLPHLEHLKMDGNYRMPAENICISLRNNPKLRSLSLTGIVPPKGFWNTCQTLAQLECLRIQSYANFKHVDTSINLPTLEKLDIRIGKNDQRLMTSKENIITFGHLKDLTLKCTGTDWLPSINSHKWSNFFKRNQSIEKVTLQFFNTDISICETIMAEAAQELTLLKELNILGHCFSVDQILPFIEKFNLMGYFFELKNENEFDNLKERLGVEWNASIDNSRYRSNYSLCIKVNRKL